MLLFAFALAAQSSQVTLSNHPPTGENRFYLGNKAPLTPSAFRKLPIGAVKPEGWVRKQLQLEADGFVGHLTDISEYLVKKDNAWLSPKGEGQHGWEEVPYWLKGFGDLGFVLGDKRIQAESRRWIEAMIASQREDGWFGPRSNLTALKGKPDVWPNMLALFALQSFYEAKQDPRVLKLMHGYFQWELNCPDADFMTGYWDKQRGGDNLYSVLWLYNRTGEKWLLDLAQKLHQHTAAWANGVPDWHGVNFAQAFREPATYALVSHDPKNLAATESDYEAMKGDYGQVPGGMYGADEVARKGFHDPRQAAETCAMVEMMGSAEMLLNQTGDPQWAERCEDVTFNSLPASMTADEKALHYLTAPNMPLADAQSKSPGLMNSGPMLLFDPNDHRCCQHNVAQGWPYFAEHLWLGTGGDGLAAILYGPSAVTTKVGDGEVVTIHEETAYPFEDTIRFVVTSRHPVTFPLTLRLPSWCSSPSATLNGKSLTLGHGASYATIDRSWRNGDKVVLHLPMQIRLHTWKDNHNSISVERGPLTYALAIGEKIVRHGGTASWPAYEIMPATAWNYGIIPNPSEMVAAKTAKSGHWSQPFDPAQCPISVVAWGRKIPEWQLDRHGLLNPLQDSPALGTGPVEALTLIPMGAARIRISAFPTVSRGAEGHKWQAPAEPKPAIPAQSSHTWQADTTDALSDGLMPSSSGDETIPRFTWWPHKGGTEWVEFDFPAVRAVRHADVYWFDDRETGGGCRVPESWRVLAWVGGAWKEIAKGGGVERDRVNQVDFPITSTTKLRLEARLQPEFSAGILEWAVR